MKGYRYLILIGFFLPLFAFAQTPQVIDSLQNEMQINKRSSDTLSLARARNMYGESLAKNGNDELAKKMFLKATSLFPKGALIEELGYTYNNLGTLLSRNNDPGGAIHFTSEARRIFSNFLGESHLYIGVINKNIAMHYGNINNPEMKLLLLMKSDSVLALHLPEAHTRRLDALREIGLTNDILGNKELAEKNFEKLLLLAEEIHPINQHERLRAYEAFASYKMKNPNRFTRQEVRATYQHYIEKMEPSIGIGHSSLRDLYNNYALQLSYVPGLESEALNMHQRAMATRYTGVDPLDPIDGPSYKEVKNPSLMDLRMLSNKGSLMYQLYAQTDSLSFLKGSFKTFQLGDSLAEHFRTVVLNQSSRFQLKNGYLHFYTLFNTTCVALYKNSNERVYLEKIFENIEKMKNWELVEKYKLSELQSHDRDSFFHRINRLGSQIKKNTLSILNQNELSINQLKLQELYQNHPSYFDLLFGFEIKKLDEIESFCKDQNQQWLHYFFLSPESIGLLAITPDTTILHLLKNKNDTVIAQCKNLLDLVQRKDWGFVDPAYALYEELIQPIESALKLPNLILSTYSILKSIPFEVLLSKKVQQSQIKEISESYLLNKYNITYQPSGTHGLLTYQKDQTISGASFFAPQYQDSSLALKWNTREVTSGQEMIGGKIFRDKNMTGHFKQSLSRNELIHFAGHTITHQERLDSIYLLMHDGLDTLFMRDILSIESKSPLIILSSCQSGVGKPSFESLMGPSYGFALAGTPNLIATLWNVSDRESAHLFKNYYSHLAQGHSSSNALRLAKISYLNEVPGPATHPLYWASAVYFGHEMTFQKKSQMVWWIITGVLLIGAFFIVRRLVGKESSTKQR